MLRTILEVVSAAAVVAGVFINWGIGWALLTAGSLGLAGVFLAGVFLAGEVEE